MRPLPVDLIRHRPLIPCDMLTPRRPNSLKTTASLGSVRGTAASGWTSFSQRRLHSTGEFKREAPALPFPPLLALEGLWPSLPDRKSLGLFCQRQLATVRGAAVVIREILTSAFPSLFF